MALLAVAPLLVHCGDDDGDDDDTVADGGTDAGSDAATDPPSLSGIAVSPEEVDLEVGETQELTVTGSFDDGSMAALDTGVTFVTSDEDVATVDANGVVTAVGLGDATITATADAFMDTTSVTVALSTSPVVFDDDFGPAVVFEPFGGSVNDLTVDTTEARSGTASLRVAVPATDAYTGGAMIVEAGRNLTAYDAVTFWAKASTAHTLNVVGFGNDAADSPFGTERPGNVALTTEWQQFTVPVPRASILTASTGLFHFAEGAEGTAYTIWFDDIVYVDLPDGTVTNPRPAFDGGAQERSEGSTFAVPGTRATYAIAGEGDVLLSPVARPFFSFVSSNTDVLTVNELGVVEAVGVGTASITGTLAGVAANGTLTVNVVAFLGPTSPAPAPTAPAVDVISLFSDAYTDVVVDTFRTPWSWGSTTLTEETIGTDNVKKYAETVFFGIETASSPLDVTDMTHLHLDLWIEGEAVVGQVFTIKIVDWGADGAFGGTGVNADTEAEIVFDAASSPALATGRWLRFDIPITDFEPGGGFDVGPGIASREHIAQYVIKSEKPGAVPTTIWIDNLYFYAE